MAAIARRAPGISSSKHGQARPGFCLAGLLAALRSHQAQEIIRMSSVQQRVFTINRALLHQELQGLLLRHRSLVLGHRDFLVEVLERISADMLAGTVADNQQLRDWYTPAMLARQKNLRKHSGECHG